MNNTIPVMHCFNNDYVIPAAVAFYSMLEHANKKYSYKLFVLHSDITEENQALLIKTIEKFPNTTLEFIDMNNKFDDLFRKTKSKGHFSKEMFYKLLAAELFKDFDKMIVSDVDVVYLSDISKVYCEFSLEENLYICAPSIIDEQNMAIKKKLYKNFSEEEISKLLIAAGFMVYNLKLMREDGIAKKLVDFAVENSDRIICPEQDALNFVCYPKVKFMPDKTMIEQRTYKNIIYQNDLNNTIQFHYILYNKPWRAKCPCANLWFEYLLKTPFFEKYMEILEKKFNPKIKTLFSFSFPFYKRKFSLIKSPKND